MQKLPNLLSVRNDSLLAYSMFITILLTYYLTNGLKNQGRGLVDRKLVQVPQ